MKDFQLGLFKPIPRPEVEAFFHRREELESVDAFPVEKNFDELQVMDLK
jgi:hypothetical protein